MNTNIELITDSSCSMPPALFEKYNITQVPLHVTVDDQSFTDPCKEAKSLQLFKSGGLSKKHAILTSPPSSDEFETYIDRAVKAGRKTVLVQTVNRAQGDTYNNANIAVSSYRRKVDGNDITVRVMDSRTVFAGQALMAVETLRLVNADKDFNDVKRYMDNFSTYIHTFVLPKEPLLAYERASQRNEKALGWTSAFIADTLGIHPVLCITNDSSYVAAKPRGFNKAARQLFSHAEKQMKKELLCPIVTINYAGPLSELEQFDGYASFIETANENKIRVIKSVMSIAGGIYTSVGSISLAFATEPHDWQGE